LCGEPLGTRITPAMVARVLAHPEGGRKGVPAGARVVAMINKVDGLADRTVARETAECLLREEGIQSVVLAAVRAEEPVLEIISRT
jgi:probable selenium-dependent hydroxylase accessory protein YqeC